jgi:hypothetical protein
MCPFRLSVISKEFVSSSNGLGESVFLLLRISDVKLPLFLGIMLKNGQVADGIPDMFRTNLENEVPFAGLVLLLCERSIVYISTVRC